MPITGRHLVICGGMGALSALTFLLVFTGNVPLGLLGQLAATPLLVLGLVKGVRAAMAAAGVGTFLTLLLGGVAHYVLGVGVGSLLLLTLAGRYRTRRDADGTVSKQWYPEGYLVTFLCVYCCFLAVVGFVSLQTMIHQGGQNGDLISAMKMGHLAGLEGVTVMDWLWMAIVASGPVMGMVMVVNGVLSMRLIKKMRLDTFRPPLTITAVRLPWAIWVAFAVFGGAVFLLPHPYDKLAMAGAATMLFALGLEGLGILHRLAQSHPRGALLMGFLYGAMILLVWPFLGVVMVGLFDPWIGLEARFKKRKER